MLENLSPADRAVVEAFCRSLALALRRLANESGAPRPDDLAQPVPPEEIDEEQQQGRA